MEGLAVETRCEGTPETPTSWGSRAPHEVRTGESIWAQRYGDLDHISDDNK